MQEHISFQFAIYYLPEPQRDPLAALESLLKRNPAIFQRVDKIKHNEQVPTMAARLESDPQRKYAPPGRDLLHRFGYGLSRDEASALQQTKSVLILDWSYSKKYVWSGMRSALTLTESLARSTGGVIWDETTREIFSPDAWEKRRVSNWSEDVPDITKHTVIHAYKKGQGVRAITLGMEKFGLPDVVIDNFSWSLNRNMGIVISLFAQAMAEGARLNVPGTFDLQFKAIKNPKVREPQTTSLKSNATGVALLMLKTGTWETGDPRNRLIEITFERGEGPDIHARQSHILAQAFGWKDDVTPVRHDKALKAASQRARAKLPMLRTQFNKGLAPGEYILVKAPFGTPGQGQEWMWVEVTSWKGVKITGLLKNEPFHIADLHAGQIVHVMESDVFDYIRKHPDGTLDGNETGKLIKRQKR